MPILNSLKGLPVHKPSSFSPRAKAILKLKEPQTAVVTPLDSIFTPDGCWFDVA